MAWGWILLWAGTGIANIRLSIGGLNVLASGSVDVCRETADIQLCWMTCIFRLLLRDWLGRGFSCLYNNEEAKIKTLENIRTGAWHRNLLRSRNSLHVVFAGHVPFGLKL